MKNPAYTVQHSKMQRRSFLRSLVAIPALMAAACQPSETAPSTPRKAVHPIPAVEQTLSFDPKAFDKLTGVSVRYIQNFEAKGITRFDVLIGYSAPTWACRVQG